MSKEPQQPKNQEIAKKQPPSGEKITVIEGIDAISKRIRRGHLFIFDEMKRSNFPAVAHEGSWYSTEQWISRWESLQVLGKVDMSIDYVKLFAEIRKEG